MRSRIEAYVDGTLALPANAYACTPAMHRTAFAFSRTPELAEVNLVINSAGMA